MKNLAVIIVVLLVVVGAVGYWQGWFTVTNVSAKQFGEGSFDKGIYIYIPLEWVAPFSSRSSYTLALRPIQRDGGQRLLGDMVLYDMTSGADYGAYTQEWNSVFR